MVPTGSTEVGDPQATHLATGENHQPKQNDKKSLTVDLLRDLKNK